MKPRRQEDSFSSSTAPCYNLIEKHHITAQPSPPPDYKCTLYRAVLKTTTPLGLLANPMAAQSVGSPPPRSYRVSTYAFSATFQTLTQRSWEAL